MARTNTKDKTVREVEKDVGGRPSVVTPKTIELLKAAYRFGASDTLACGYAEISTSSLYRYQQEHPEFREQKERWKDEPKLIALKRVVGSLSQNTSSAWKYLEKKMPEEFGNNEGVVGQPLLGAPQNKKEQDLMVGMLKRYDDYREAKRRGNVSNRLAEDGD